MSFLKFDQKVLNKSVGANCCVVAKKVEHADETLRSYICQISFVKVENKLMRNLEQNKKEAYRLCKIMKHKSFCGSNDEDISQFLTSYMFKNSLFHNHQNCNNNAKMLAAEIYQDILTRLENNETLPMFFLPDQDIFVQYSHRNEAWASQSKMYCENILKKIRGDFQNKTS